MPLYRHSEERPTKKRVSKAARADIEDADDNNYEDCVPKTRSNQLRVEVFPYRERLILVKYFVKDERVKGAWVLRYKEACVLGYVVKEFRKPSVNKDCVPVTEYESISSIDIRGELERILMEKHPELKPSKNGTCRNGEKKKGEKKKESEKESEKGEKKIFFG